MKSRVEFDNRINIEKYFFKKDNSYVNQVEEIIYLRNERYEVEELTVKFSLLDYEREQQEIWINPHNKRVTGKMQLLDYLTNEERKDISQCLSPKARKIWDILLRGKIRTEQFIE